MLREDIALVKQMIKDSCCQSASKPEKAKDYSSEIDGLKKEIKSLSAKFDDLVAEKKEVEVEAPKTVTNPEKVTKPKKPFGK